jgi:inhibitor of KinA sporulation pathway (predicted exonuclease)
MIDIETLGTQFTAPIINISAALFDLHSGNISNTFAVNINPDSQKKYGYAAEASTIEWWTKSNHKQLVSLLTNTTDSQDAFRLFYDYINQQGQISTRYVWAKGSSFDLAMIKNFAEKLGYVTLPWNYYNEMCCRSLFNLFKNTIVEKHTFQGDKHNPLHDIQNQAQILSKIINQLNLENANR